MLLRQDPVLCSFRSQFCKSKEVNLESDNPEQSQECSILDFSKEFTEFASDFSDFLRVSQFIRNSNEIAIYSKDLGLLTLLYSHIEAEDHLLIPCLRCVEAFSVQNANDLFPLLCDLALSSPITDRNHEILHYILPSVKSNKELATLFIDKFNSSASLLMNSMSHSLFCIHVCELLLESFETAKPEISLKYEPTFVYTLVVFLCGSDDQIFCSFQVASLFCVCPDLLQVLLQSGSMALATNRIASEIPFKAMSCILHGMCNVFLMCPDRELMNYFDTSFATIINDYEECVPKATKDIFEKAVFRAYEYDVRMNCNYFGESMVNLNLVNEFSDLFPQWISGNAVHSSY